MERPRGLRVVSGRIVYLLTAILALIFVAQLGAEDCISFNPGALEVKAIICYVGRPQPSMTYLKRGATASPVEQGQASPSSGGGAIVLYGRSTCGLCKRMMQDLEPSRPSVLVP
jgi:hypothetical protein